MIIQSEKGSQIFEAIKDKANYIDYGIQNVRQYNRHIENQAYRADDYERFQEDYVRHGFKYASEKAVARRRDNSLVKYIKRQIKRLVK